jgi:aspartyl-tRNA(Asn)/glutamyl-tRNA(Gln) amidotransferase subunit A
MPTADRPTLMELAAAYRRGDRNPSEVTEAMLARLQPGAVVRLVTADRARAQAAAATSRWRRGQLRGPLDGIPIVIKDLLDTARDVTAAGSAALFERPAAAQDAPVAARLDAAGAIFLGKSTMTELAFGGLGLNPHTGTPGNALDPLRVPGGSSSGSAVAVATGLAVVAVGSDTGGSVRIPAAFNGLVGLKTSDGAIPTDGAMPLSTTLDTLGPIARTAEDAWVLWRAMAALPSAPLPDAPERGRFWAPPTVWREGLEPGVAARFEAAIDALRSAGHAVDEAPLPELAELDGLYARFGSFAAHEAWALHEGLLARAGASIDPRVSHRILAAAGRPAADYIRLGYARARLRNAVWLAAGPYDALLAPTVAVVAPRIAALVEDAAYFSSNAAVLRNTTLGNLLGGPAATLPIGHDGEGQAVGLMVMCAPSEDAAALSWGAALQRCVTGGSA